MDRRTFLKALAVAGLAGKAWAGGGNVIRVGPGEMLTLNDNLVLTDDISLLIDGTTDQPSIIEGNQFSIYSQGMWTGAIAAHHCTFRNLGTPSAAYDNGNPAIVLAASGAASVLFDACTFDACNQVLITTNDNADLNIVNNTFLANGTFWIDSEPEPTQYAMVFDGTSVEPKLFQGNTVLRGGPVFGSGGWLIGGDGPQGNVISGYRGSLSVYADDAIVRGNFIHAYLHVDEIMYPFWSQMVTVTGTVQLFENNVVRSGRYVLRNINGEFRGNLIIDVHGGNFVQYGTASVHHNIFAHIDEERDRIYDDYRPIARSVCEQISAEDGISFFNNTIDGRGIGADAPAANFGITLDDNAFMPNADHNVFFGVPGWYVAGPVDETEAQPPYPERLGYADYNLFWDSPGIPFTVNVPGLNYGDEGFGANDINADPQFQGPLPDRFPFATEDIVARVVTVDEILSYYRQVYAPAPGSPIYGAGIGAV